MSDVPKRFKDRDQYSMDEELAAVQATRRGDDPPKFETAAYREHRRDVLREGGLIDEAEELAEQDAGPPPLDEMGVGDHLRRIRSQGGGR